MTRIDVCSNMVCHSVPVDGYVQTRRQNCIMWGLLNQLTLFWQSTCTLESQSKQL